LAHLNRRKLCGVERYCNRVVHDPPYALRRRKASDRIRCLHPSVEAKLQGYDDESVDKSINRVRAGTAGEDRSVKEVELEALSEVVEELRSDVPQGEHLANFRLASSATQAAELLLHRGVRLHVRSGREQAVISATLRKPKAATLLPNGLLSAD